MNVAAVCTICAAAILAGAITFCILATDAAAPFTFSETLLTSPGNVVFWVALALAFPLIVTSRVRTLTGAVFVAALYSLLLLISLYKFVDGAAHATIAVVFVLALCAVYTYDVWLLMQRDTPYALCGSLLVMTLLFNLSQFVIYAVSAESYAYMALSIAGYYMLVMQFLVNTLTLDANNVYYLAHSASA